MAGKSPVKRVTSSGRRSKFWQFRVIAVRRIGRAPYVDARWLDQRADRRGVPCARGYGSFLARRFRARRRRGHQGECVCRSAAGEDRGCAAGCAPLLAAPVANRANWRSPPHRRDQKARTRRYRAIATLQGAAKKNFRWRRPRHTLKGRQIAAEIERVGLRLRCARPRPRPAILFSSMRRERGADASLSARAWANAAPTCACRAVKPRKWP